MPVATRKQESYGDMMISYRAEIVTDCPVWKVLMLEAAVNTMSFVCVCIGVFR